MHAKAIALIHILRGALIELEQNSSTSETAGVSTCEVRNSMLQAIHQLEMVCGGSQDLRAA